MRRHAIGALACLVLASCAAPAPTPHSVDPTTSSSPAPAEAIGTSPVAPIRPEPSDRSTPPTPSADDVGALRDRLHWRCKVTPFWVSPDRARVAECVSLDREPRSPEGHFSLTVYDVATDAQIEQHVVGEGDALRAQTAVRQWLAYTPLLPYVSHAEQARTERAIRAIAPSRAEGEGLVVRYVAPTLTFADRRGTRPRFVLSPSRTRRRATRGARGGGASPHSTDPWDHRYVRVSRPGGSWSARW